MKWNKQLLRMYFGTTNWSLFFTSLHIWMVVALLYMIYRETLEGMS